MVTVENGEMKEASKGTCKSEPPYRCPGYTSSPESWFAYDTKSDGTLKLKGFTSEHTSSDTEIAILCTIDGVKVTEIGAIAFMNKNITKLQIPSSVTTIGSAAFNNNKLNDDEAYIYARTSIGEEDKTALVSYGGLNKDITIPENVITIGYGAFAGTGITSLIIPSSVVTIGEQSFYYTNLASIQIPSSVEKSGKLHF